MIAQIRTVVWLARGGRLVRADAAEARYTDWRERGGVPLASHRTGEVVQIQGPEGRTYIRKGHWYPTARDRWRGVLRNTAGARSRVRREAENLLALHRRGLNPDLVVAVGERRRGGFLWDSFLVLHHWPGDRFDHFLDRLEEPERRQRVVRLAEFVAQLHHHRYVDRDLHLRNVLVRPPSMTLAKVDCSRGAFFHRLDRRHDVAVRRDLNDLSQELRTSYGESTAAAFGEAYACARAGLRH